MNWTRHDDEKMIINIKSGKSPKVIAIEMNKSESDIKIKLGKIIYDNIKNGKNINMISRLLNIAESDIVNYISCYKKPKQEHKTTNCYDEIEYNNTSTTKEQYKSIDDLKLDNEKLRALIENYELKEKLRRLIGIVHVKN